MSIKQQLLHRLYGQVHAYRWLAGRDRDLAPLLPYADTEICIEGYPRSGNTFAVIAFEKAQARPVSISHHLHAEGQVIWAARRGIPVIVLLRRPADAVASLVLRDRGIGDDLALARYIAFYRALEDWRDRIVVSRFETTTSGMRGAVEAVNERFGTRFVAPAGKGVSDASVFAEIDRLNASREGGDVHQIARPDEAKSDALAIIKSRIERHPNFQRANEVWQLHDRNAF